MIDTVLLCVGWATLGYAVARIENERLVDTIHSSPIRPVATPPPPPRDNAISLKHRPDRFACFYCKRWRHNRRFDIAWCDHDRPEFPDLCGEYDPKHGNHGNVTR